MRPMFSCRSVRPCEGVRALALLGSVLLLFLTACNSSSSETALVGAPLSDHPHVPLLDAAGNHLSETSTAPYSPRETCGACHDYDLISHGYHFQQGRTDEYGSVITKDDYFGDGRDFLQSPGMYGKW